MKVILLLKLMLDCHKFNLIKSHRNTRQKSFQQKLYDCLNENFKNEIHNWDNNNVLRLTIQNLQ